MRTAWLWMAPLALAGIGAAPERALAQPPRPSPAQSVASRPLLAAMPAPAEGQAAYLAEPGREGWFRFERRVRDADIAADPAQALFVPGTGGIWVRIHSGKVDARWFGAKGDGVADDTPALQRAIDHVSRAGGGIVIPPGVYSVTNLTIPAYPMGPGNPLKVIEITGTSMPVTQFGSAFTFPVSDAGTIIKSSATSGGAILQVAAGAGFGNFSWYHVVLEDLNFRTYDNPRISAVDMGNASQLTAVNLQIDSGIYSVNAARPTHGTSGLVTPRNNNAALTLLRTINISGYYNLLQVNEHTDADEINLGAGWYGLLFNDAHHASRFGRVLAYRVNTPIAFAGPHSFAIEQLDIEHSITAAEATDPADLSVGNGYQVTQEDFRDTANGARGYVNWHVVQGNVGRVDKFTINGAKHVQFRQLGEAIPAISRVVQPGNQSIPSDSDTAVRLLQAESEGAAMSAGDDTQIVFARQGTYRITARIAFASHARGFRRLQLEVGGIASSTDAANAVDGSPTFLTATLILGVKAGTVLRIKAYQNSGGPLDLVAATDAGVVTIEKLRDDAL
ncbi:MAG: glycosyl hydrolase family 28-related protein [Allosphingosinicella sp.]